MSYLIVAIVALAVGLAVGQWLGYRGCETSAELRSDCMSPYFLNGKPYYIVPESVYISMIRRLPDMGWKSVGDEVELEKQRRDLNMDRPKSEPHS